MVKAKVLDVDVEKERISLGIKQLGGDPIGDGDTYKKGQTVTVTVTSIDIGRHRSEVRRRRRAGRPPSSASRTCRRDRNEQRPERFAVGDRVDAQITNIDKATRRVSVSIKALEMADEKEAIEQFGSSDSGASLGDILGAALREKAEQGVSAPTDRSLEQRSNGTRAAGAIRPPFSCPRESASATVTPAVRVVRVRLPTFNALT